MTSFEELWEKELLSHINRLTVCGDDEIEIIRLVCNMAFVEGSTDGYHRGMEEGVKIYNKALGIGDEEGRTPKQAKLWAVGTSEGD